MKLKQILKNIRYIMQIIWKNEKSYLLFSVLQIISNSICPFINIVGIKLLVDCVQKQSSLAEIFQLVIWIVVLNFIFTNLKTLSDSFVKLGAKKLMMPMSALFSKKAADMDYSYTENPMVLQQLGKASYVLLNSDNLELYLNAINYVVVYFVQLIITATIIISLKSIFILLILVIACICLFLNLKTQDKNYQLQSEIMEKERRWKYIIDLAVNMKYGKTVRMYDLNDYILNKGKENREEYFILFGKKIKNTKINNVLCTILNAIPEAVILVWLVFNVISEKVTIGDFTLLLSVSTQFSSSFEKLATEIINLYSNDNYINEFFLFIYYKSELRETKVEGLELKHEEPYEFEFKNVSFRYPNSDKYTLKNISLKIKPGERITIVGENGAGKTTFVKLLMRLYDVTEGEILYKGRNIKDYDYDEYMDVFATVFQDYKMFALSLYDNIDFYHGNERKEQIDQVLKKYNMWDVVNKLPEGGDTVISKLFEEEGMELSGGQQQRIALCRAVYKNAPVVVLDEPTANLSPKAEHEIYQQFDELSKGKTAFYISHRLSSSKFSDKICVFSDGQIIEYGTHDELMRNNNSYASMFRLQAQYYMEEV